MLEVPCNLCGRETGHDVVHTETVSRETAGVNVPVRIEVLSCRGCNEISIRNGTIEKEFMEKKKYC